MPSTKMFRDRVVSMEQTFEKGEKHLALLKTIVDEAIPGMELQDYVLDHEHDCFVMNYRTAAGAPKKVSWTRMVLYDAERVPAIVENADAEIRRRLVEFLRKRAERNVIDVTFRHLEEGWVDTPEPRKPKAPAPREKGQPGGGRPAGGGGRPPQGKGGPARPGGQPGGGAGRPQPGGRPGPPPRPAGPRPGGAPPPAGGEGAPGEGAPAGAGRRRRFRRRRGRRRGGPGSGPASPPAGGAPAP